MDKDIIPCNGSNIMSTFPRFLTLALSGLGCFGSSLAKFKRRESDRCPRFNVPETPYHVFYQCPRFSYSHYWDQKTLLLWSRSPSSSGADLAILFFFFSPFFGEGGGWCKKMFYFPFPLSFFSLLILLFKFCFSPSYWIVGGEGEGEGISLLPLRKSAPAVLHHAFMFPPPYFFIIFLHIFFLLP